jgi:hypothetical protein
VCPIKLVGADRCDVIMLAAAEAARAACTTTARRGRKVRAVKASAANRRGIKSPDDANCDEELLWPTEQWPNVTGFQLPKAAFAPSRGSTSHGERNVSTTALNSAACSTWAQWPQRLNTIRRLSGVMVAALKLFSI